MICTKIDFEATTSRQIQIGVLHAHHAHLFIYHFLNFSQIEQTMKPLSIMD